MALAFTVLFVDDDPQIREIVVDVLSLKGFRVLAAESAFEGLRVLTQEHVDVLFSDLVMPGMSGIELAKKARRFRPDLQIMFATGYSARAPEADHFGKIFIKPLRAHQIEAELCELMSVH
jgi:CheY-like chemotaxis protein